MCAQCGKAFTSYRKPKKTKKLFCSPACYGHYIHGKYARNNKIKCLNCGRVFVKPTNASATKVSPRKYCNRACMFQHLAGMRKDGAMSAPEAMMAKAVTRWAPSMRRQYNPLASFTAVDIFVPSKDLCIYVDGVYWHSRKETQERDLRQNKILKAAGLRVLRISDKRVRAVGIDGLIAILNKKYGGCIDGQ